jgi:DNA-binding transcriptional LysR family regulator
MELIDGPGDWADIAVFLAVLDAGTLTDAAERLGATQPTVGRRLASYEKRIGAKLFARTGRRMAPTELAYRIEESARKMDREMDAIRRAVAGASHILDGEITISANEGTGSEWLVPVLADLKAMYPSIYIQLKIEARSADLVQREADIALRLGRPTQLDLVARKLATVGFGVYASRSWLDRQAPINCLGDLTDKDWVAGDFSKNASILLTRFFAENGLEQRGTMSTNSPTAQLRAVQRGLGLGVISHRWAADYPTMVRVLPDVEPASIDLWLVYHEDLRTSRRVRVVADFIADAARRDAHLFSTGVKPDETRPSAGISAR